jgi:hypothetical protein
MNCSLCQSEKIYDFFQDKSRNYYQCQICSLVFVPSLQFLSRQDEKKRYDLHRNSPDDPGYCRFLRRMLIAMEGYLCPGSRGLDFGSGPAPTLSLMFEEAGHSVTLFDYFYENVPAVLENQYDFVTATEVVEHLHEPGKELERLWSCVRKGGVLGIMTRALVEQDAFSAWNYKNDLTHVCFFSPSAFRWLAHKWKADLTFAGSDVVLFRKQ